jgi:molecular chaperone GrpE (heat shock protein)
MVLAMTNRPAPSLQKWSFVLADISLLLVCAWTIHQSMPAKDTFDRVVVISCIVAWMFGTWICVKPWLEEFKAQNKHLENETLASAVEQIQRVEEVAARIQAATGSWQSAQEAAKSTATVAGEIEEKIRANMKDFMDFNERINSEEKKHMGLEIEKLRRAESEWLQVAARMLDHTFLLNQAAARSGQENLIAQLGTFQNALRDVARRMGLVPILPTVGQEFDGRAHQTETPEVEPAARSTINEVLATGFTFQGQLLRRALVRVASTGSEVSPAEPPAEQAEAMPEGTETPVVESEPPVEQEVPSQQTETADAPAPEPEPQGLVEVSSESPTVEPEAESDNPPARRRTRRPDPQATLPL